MILWKGRAPKITREQYDQVRAIHVVRRGKSDRCDESITAYARSQGLNPNSVRWAALHGIKRYEVRR